ncbi:hypothetical protein SDRG_16325 [Saprolegnia diclina VS20]|uniref:Uncharacterized protein n=1 Tax=Saprolegnia diclina (strain VS20) TaxID=1156394 RepID=T0PK98_SAPDV|nr:hypothetical protein SDRG_16325 [Saprolegnia diclina VS20]EQC25809.1 hypothetical protein SDRG_16325 [Saprolegnia diclina VS20]|eukprot:XP_008620751.1 hypothetical protein SDRG_16325 [Saprolegnia diclina VS20]
MRVAISLALAPIAVSATSLLGGPAVVAFAAATHATDLSPCTGQLLASTPASCAWLADATRYGVDQLNHMINTASPVMPMLIVSAVDKPVAGAYESHLLELQVQVAPCLTPSNHDDKKATPPSNAHVCDFDFDQVAKYQLLLSQANATQRWTLVDSLQVFDSGVQGGKPELRPLPDFLPVQDASESPAVPFGQLFLHVLIVAACLLSMVAVVAHSLKTRREGYAAISRQVQTKQVRRVDLRHSNPVPRHEENVLRYSHEQNERFAV